MKQKIQRRSANIHFQRENKKQFRLTMKLADQLIRYKAKEKAIMAFLQEYLGPGTDCPVLLEPFSSEHPPYKLSSCEHRLSLTALYNLKLFNKDNQLGTAYMSCPICRNMTLFAHNDNQYLQAVKLWEHLKKIDNSTTNVVLELLNVLIESSKKEKLTYFNPKGGILELWEQMCYG